MATAKQSCLSVGSGITTILRSVAWLQVFTSMIQTVKVSFDSSNVRHTSWLCTTQQVPAAGCIEPTAQLTSPKYGGSRLAMTSNLPLTEQYCEMPVRGALCTGPSETKLVSYKYTDSIHYSLYRSPLCSLYVTSAVTHAAKDKTRKGGAISVVAAHVHHTKNKKCWYKVVGVPLPAASKRLMCSWGCRTASRQTLTT
jgi:hypothetical protein